MGLKRCWVVMITTPYYHYLPLTEIALEISYSILPEIPTKVAVSSFMGYPKGKNAVMIFERHGNLKYKFGNRHFWAIGYYVSAVGLNEATIAKYIREQEKHDQMLDGMWAKEHNDPFKG